ncbi:MAG: transmembrane 220 family protein [Candidatus Hydrogenedentes bacterium]|nr:transmembrane 220 family protein [Candidatus Hydrogenedentota bacterium]
MFRFANAVMLILFMTAFSWQFNDPDGVLWLMIYGYAAIITAMAYNRWYTHWAAVGAVGYFAGFFTLIQHWDPAVPWIEIEEVREAFGLLICGAWMLVLTAAWLRRPKESRPSYA